VRRLLVFCAVTVAILAAFAASRRERAALAAGPGSLGAIAVDRFQAGCPLGPAFTFCDQIPGTSSATAVFHVANTQAVTGVSVALVAIPGLSSNFTVADFTIGTNTCTGNLAAGQGCQIGVAFSPTTTGLRAASLQVTDAGGDTLAFHVEGTGKDLTLAPPAGAAGYDNALTFPSTPIGGTSVADTLTLSAGVAETGVSVSFAAIPGLSSEFAAGDFTIASTTCTGALAPSASCTVNVEFTPTANGLRAAVLTATDSNGDSTTIYLAGRTPTGLQIGQFFSNPPACVVEQQAGFCAEPSGGTTPTIGYTLQNTSGTQITGLTITPPVTPPTPAPPPPDFTVTGTSCVSALAANASCTINVAFTPQGTGLRQGTVTVTDSQGDIAGFNLAGVGDDYSLSLASGQSEEVTIIQGGTATYNGVVTPDSVFGQRGEQVTFDCPTTLPINTSCVITPCPAQITPGTPATFQMVFVTSTQTVVAPIPPQGTGCSSYGPPGTTEVLPDPNSSPRAPHFPALPILAIFGTIALLSGWIVAKIGSMKTRRRVPLVFAMAGLAAAALTGCHHSTKIASPETPLGTTTMDFQAPALDAAGNPLNASRPGPEIILDIVQKTGPIP
jgi:hypothetical protein